MNVVILGDKFRKGLKSKGCCGLIQRDQKSVIQHQIDFALSLDLLSSIYYVAGFDYNRLLSYINKNYINSQLSKVICNHDYAKFNESYSLSIALDAIDHIDDDLLIINGYYCPPKNLKNLDRSKSSVFTCNKEKTKLGCIINNNSVENIFFGLNNYVQDIYYINKKDIDIIKNIIKSKMHNNFLFEIVNKSIDSGCFFTNFNLDTKKNTNDRHKKNSCVQ